MPWRRYIKQRATITKLIDYAVRIPPGSSSDALCETIITWTNNGKEFKTRGLDSDQTVAAIIATQKLNVIPTPTLSEEQMNLPGWTIKLKNYNQIIIMN
jgi:D-citramalate synthase